MQSKDTGKGSFDYLALGSKDQVPFNTMCCSTKVPDAKENCHPFVIVHFAIGTSVLRTKLHYLKYQRGGVQNSQSKMAKLNFAFLKHRIIIMLELY